MLWSAVASRASELGGRGRRLFGELRNILKKQNKYLQLVLVLTGLLYSGTVPHVLGRNHPSHVLGRIVSAQNVCGLRAAPWLCGYNYVHQFRKKKLGVPHVLGRTDVGPYGLIGRDFLNGRVEAIGIFVVQPRSVSD